MNLVLGDAGHEFAVVLRNALWGEGAEVDGEAYIDNPPLSLYRVTPTTATSFRRGRRKRQPPCIDLTTRDGAIP
jgi:hypothetical protein